jgi:hypothetical protein
MKKKVFVLNQTKIKDSSTKFKQKTAHGDEHHEEEGVRA